MVHKVHQFISLPSVGHKVHHFISWFISWPYEYFLHWHKERKIISSMTCF